ncbi:OmpA family protein [Alkalispirochaeta americana]|uniref:OmpA family protein n=1 Tax=Alkalispirochaeta americana TaxID=159291 RepID=A0A1N6UG97_9SPIO|nr:OmpA family protein [Alkalispirochaeta americana]SIQ64557.1 OmpA family protein [Alkalispirochaeta americana]
MMVSRFSRVVWVILVLGWTGSAVLAAEEARLFRYAHRPGEQYRIVGVNRQEIFLNGESLGTTEILTRLRVRLEEDWRVHGHYQISEETDLGTSIFAMDREEEVSFIQHPLGPQEVPASSFIPQVRDVPSFPEGAVLPGETWEMPGQEVYDFREGLGVSDPLVLPIRVSYTYQGMREFEGASFPEVLIRYSVFFRPSRETAEARELRLMTGQFSQRLLWDEVAGRPHYYEEDYTHFIQFADGTRVELRGVADGRVLDAPPLERDRLRDDIEQSMRDRNVRDTTVRSDQQGVTISLEDIRFAPDSAEIMDSELEKLEWLAEILKDHPDRDVLITGHTARAGTEEGRQRLSEERAQAVGQFLLGRGVRTREQLLYQGKGARNPISSEDTPQGRRRNRRVEITILEN